LPKRDLSTLQEQQFAGGIETFFAQGRCFLFAKGRVGLYAGLRGMDLPRGATVLMPGYTCMVVPSAAQFAGLTPAYIDIDPQTYNIRPDLLDAAPSGAAALVVQHTYGIPCDIAAIGGWAERRRLPIIEDCCHAFGTKVDGRLCGTLGKFAFMSGQWNKPFSTGLGGMLLVNDSALADAVQRLVQSERNQPGRLTDLVLRCQIAAHDWLVRPSSAMLLTLLYRALNRVGLVRGSSSPGELRGVMPDDYFTGMAPCQVRRGLRELARIDANIRHRVGLTAFYQRELARIGFSPLRVCGVEEMPLLRYPVRVANKAEVLSRAVRSGVEIGSWFECPLHPEGTRQEDFGYRDGMCPEAERAAREVVNLPTHLKVKPGTAERVLEFLRRHATPAENGGGL
jgi:perosamine synthetase